MWLAASHDTVQDISIYTEGVRNNRQRLFDSPRGVGGGRKLSSNREGTHGVRVRGGGGRTIFLLILRECKTGFYGSAECAINEAVYPSV